MLSDEGYTCVMEINVVDDTSKDDANSASMLGTAEGRVDNNGQVQNPFGRGTSTMPSFDAFTRIGSP